MNLHLRFKKNYHRWSKTILDSTWLYHHLLYTSALQAAPVPPQTDGLGILICSCVILRWILDLKK